jgi:NAD(P)H dehydrogenase (quinone)
VVRDPAKAGDVAARGVDVAARGVDVAARGVDVAVADYNSPESFDGLLRAGDRVLLISGSEMHLPSR